jgi:drug/metabolite transporter (DMT)-like permease
MPEQFINSRFGAGFCFALASAALFAIRPIFVKLVYAQGVDPLTLIGFRMLFSIPIYIVLLIYFLSNDPELRAKLNPKLVAKIGLTGLFGYYFASYLDLLGLQYVTAQLGRMILYIYPTIVVVLGVVFFGRSFNWRIVLSLLITYVGVAVIFSHDVQLFGGEVVTGALFIVASALSFACYLLFSKSLIDDIGSKAFTCIALISASAAILFHYLFYYGATRSFTEPDLNTQALWWILVIAIFCTVIPTFFTAAAIARIGSDKTGIVATLGPAFTSLAAVTTLGEDFTLFHFVGITLTVIGVSILQQRKPLFRRSL